MHISSKAAHNALSLNCRATIKKINIKIVNKTYMSQHAAFTNFFPTVSNINMYQACKKKIGNAVREACNP